MATSQGRLKKLFKYREDGQLIRISFTDNHVPIGEPAGTKTKDGYISIGVDKKIYRAHRLIWLYHNGSLPKYIDHINGIRDDNRIENLQAVTQSQNTMKGKTRLCNTSGFRGVSFRKDRNHWIAILILNNTRIYLGGYKNIEDAIEARKEGELKYFGQFQPIDKDTRGQNLRSNPT